MTFAEDLAALPIHATQPQAAGFLPPLLRAQGHLMLVLVQVADENATPDEDELLTELKDARDHWAAINAGDALSATATTALQNYADCLNDAIDEFQDWETKDRIKNVRDLASRAASLAVVLDRELVGLTDSDGGYNL